MKLQSLSIILPAFNEEAVIEKTIDSCRNAAENITPDYEILIVDGGSLDRTKEIIKGFCGRDDRIKGIFLSQRGYGRALSTGFSSAKKDFIFYTDSDAPINILKELPLAASLISDGTDAVIGYRVNRDEDMPLRRIYSIAYNFINKALLNTRVRDVNFSCKLMRREVFNKIKLRSCSAFIDAELMSKLNFHRFKVKEFPAVYVARMHGYSNFDSPIYAFKLFIEMAIFWFRYRILRIKS